jgi:hypothetical protein
MRRGVEPVALAATPTAGRDPNAPHRPGVSLRGWHLAVDAAVTAVAATLGAFTHPEAEPIRHRLDND